MTLITLLYQIIVLYDSMTLGKSKVIHPSV